MNSPAYAYASGDLLEQRNTYFYSVYRGEAFLHAWRQQRAEAQSELSIAVDVDADSSEASLGAPTDLLLESLYRDLITNGELTETATLDHLVQRFEVSKRLHGEYDARWRPVDATDYRPLARYLRFAEVLTLAYERSRRLTYLNALLKVVDTLTAVRHKLEARGQARLKIVIACENTHIEDLRVQLNARQHAA